MVRPGARSDDDLGAVTDRNGRVERRAVTASSRGVRGRHRLQLGVKFFEQLAGSVLVDSSYSGAEYGATARGISSSDVGLGRDSGTSRSEEVDRVGSLCIHSSEGNEDEREDDDNDDDDDDDDDSDDDGDDHEPVPVVETSSSCHTPAPGKGKGFTGSLMSVMSLANGPQDPVIVPSYSDHVAGCIWCGQDRGILKLRSRYVSLTGWTPSDPVVDLAGVANSPRSELSTEQKAACYVLYLLGSSLFTDKSGNNVPGGLRTNPMGFLMYGFLRTMEHRRPANNRVYMVKNVFIEALWLEAPSHLLTSTLTSILAIPPSRYIDDYMPWFLPRVHPWIQNPYRLSCGVQMPTIAPITLQVLLDMVAHELDRNDIDDAMKVTWASDMIKRYHQTRR
ncbi:hypothetical protein M9H77_17241 [Catharanthus roseus]|uniref:Uncharacterized protein n=1 Tax=Catharanthus roseus TaxID=4058 RepID=A0ACC0B4E3_CATRO|nr:hypothetical protein M9H77_17241 [Catharanthus roseus]